MLDAIEGHTGAHETPGTLCSDAASNKNPGTHPVTLYDLITEKTQNNNKSDACSAHSPQPTDAEQNQTGLSSGLSSGAMLQPIAASCVIADSLMKMNYMATARKYIWQNINALLAGNAPGPVPSPLLEKWQAPGTAALLIRMWMKTCIFSTYLSKKQASRVLRCWLQHEPEGYDPLLRLGLLMALKHYQHKKPVLKEAIDLLMKASHIMANERTDSALMLADQGVQRQLRLPYDNDYIFVYPDIRNMSTYVLLEQGDWFEEDMHLFRKLIQPGDRVLDLGANIGVYAVSAAHRAGSNGKVVAVEPCAATAAILKKTADRFDNMICIRAAVSETTGSGTLNAADPEFIKLQIQDGPNRKGDTVNVITVDDLAESAGIAAFDLIKIDVEGHEVPTLKGAENIIGRGNPIIFYEIKRGDGYVNYDLIEYFQHLGYDSYYFCWPSNSLVKYRPGSRLDSFIINMIAAKPESLGRFTGIADVQQSI